MKACAAFFAMAVFSTSLSTSALGQTPAPSKASAATRTEMRIAAAHEAILKDPGRYQGYNDLAYNLVKQAEETGDQTNLEKAEAAIEKSLAIAPRNFQGEKTEVYVLLGEQEYAKALDEAKALNHDTPDDVLLWGYLADAQMALGDYDAAEKSAQWMLNLRPGNVPGLLRGAELRMVWGDADGAMEFLTQALEVTPDFETGDVAAILTEMANVQLASGKVDSAERLDEKALNTFPNYYAALESLAKVRTAQRRYEDAVETLVKRNSRAPRPEILYALAEALERAGRGDEAKQVYGEFERQAMDEINRADNANRELIFYYLGHAANPAEALRIAALEATRRHDLRTLDAYAWALEANHDHAGAYEQISKVLVQSVCDAAVFFHAGAIAEQMNDPAAATHYWKDSLKLNPYSESADAAREALEKMAPASAETRELN
jgi:tetratricopeptide (TPR) repeat protein